MAPSVEATTSNISGQPLTQAGHLLAIESKLGKDVLLLTRLDGVETVSRGFVYTIEMLTRATEKEVRRLLGEPVTLWLRNDSKAQLRPLHGHVRHLTRLSVNERGYDSWRAEVAPWLWFLTHSVDCRIYQDQSIPDILRSVFDEHGLIHYELRLQNQYPKLPFCVQYRESTFAFVSRLMEHFGIFYCFEHFPEKHLLVVSDNSTLANFITPRQVTLASRADIGDIKQFQPSYTFRPGNWALNDFDFESPTKNLQTRERTLVDIEPMQRFEVFDYPGHYLGRDSGSVLTRLRMEREEVLHNPISGVGSCVAFDPGKRFTLASNGADRAADQTAYFLTEVRHSARDAAYFASSGAPATYGNQFTVIPAKMPFRPERLTPWPVVQGPQTATVVGPGRENIHTDEYGRVRLHFHWDRRGKRDEHASCWIRVSQVSAGSHWGSLAIPHVGQEVIVAFLEGDPDRPIVTGRVHNGTNMPPLCLPRDKEKTILRDHGDNKIIMHGKASAQRLSLVSPRAINFVAMRGPAKPLSSDVGPPPGTPADFAPGIDPFKDNKAYYELEYIYDELMGITPPTAATESSAPTVFGPIDNGIVYSIPTPIGTQYTNEVTDKKTGETTGGNAVGYLYDINSLSENSINSMSLQNTNAWVGKDMNTWVGGAVNQEVHGSTTNTYHSQVTDNFDTLHEENTDIHNEFCLVHSEFTSAHFENTIGIHTESHVGPHIEDLILKIKNLLGWEVEDKGGHVKTAALNIINTEAHIIT